MHTTNQAIVAHVCLCVCMHVFADAKLTPAPVLARHGDRWPQTLWASVARYGSLARCDEDAMMSCAQTWNAQMCSIERHLPRVIMPRPTNQPLCHPSTQLCEFTTTTPPTAVTSVPVSQFTTTPVCARAVHLLGNQLRRLVRLRACLCPSASAQAGPNFITHIPWLYFNHL